MAAKTSTSLQLIDFFPTFATADPRYGGLIPQHQERYLCCADTDEQVRGRKSTNCLDDIMNSVVWFLQEVRPMPDYIES